MSIHAVVLDLDLTFWQCGNNWIDCCQPPFKRHSNGEIRDSNGQLCQLFPDSLAVLDYCDRLKLPLTIASRTSEPNWANQMLDLMGLVNRFTNIQIYPGCKIQHLNQIARSLELKLNQLLFFDDEYRNIQDAQSIGVHAIHCPDGLNLQLVQNSFTQKMNQAKHEHSGPNGLPQSKSPIK